MTFAFDEHFAMFDITPVENQFILEYLPEAKGDYVKVYLYGLLCCYHPKKEMDAETVGRELGMTEEEILQAFRYWERRGILRRVKDHPPEWKFINIKQKNLETDDTPEAEYVRFCREVENCFEGSRDFHGQELAACYEWKEDLHLSTEVIIMLLKHMERVRGRHFKIRDAEKTAIMLSEENAFTTEEAEKILERDEAMNTGFRKILRKMGKKYTPSDANLQLYNKWIREWHFTHDAVEAACDHTGTSDPSLALIDAILDQIRQNAGDPDAVLDSRAIENYEKQRDDLREVLTEMGQYGPVTPARQNLYSRMCALYPKEIILLAARECAVKQSSFDSVLKLLESWRDRGFTQEQQILDHIHAFHDKEEFMKSIRNKWAGKNTDPGTRSMQMLEKWETEYGFNREMITLAAELAFEAKKPLAYMDSLLSGWAKEGIRTPEEAKQKGKPENLKSGSKPGKTVSAQQYSQRDYSHEQEDAMRRMIGMNGGDGDA